MYYSSNEDAQKKITNMKKEIQRLEAKKKQLEKAYRNLDRPEATFESGSKGLSRILEYAPKWKGCQKDIYKKKIELLIGESKRTHVDYKKIRERIRDEIRSIDRQIRALNSQLWVLSESVRLWNLKRT